MNSKNLQTIAVFMAALVVMLPIYSANVFAARINVEVKGQDNLAGYARSNDELDISAQIALPEEARVDQGQFRMFRDTIQNPITCTRVGDTSDWECRLNFNIYNSRSHTIDFVLFSDEFPFGAPNDADFENALAEILDYSIIVDLKGPDVTELTLDKAITRTGQVKINYNRRITQKEAQTP